jgi:type II secretory pathway pseudopilin PulG
MTDPVTPVTRSGRKLLTIIAVIAVLAILALLIGPRLLGSNNKGGSSNSAAPAAATASAETEVPVETPTDEPSTVPTNTPSPLPTGNGSGCDLGKDFTVQVQSDKVEHDAGAVFNGTACLKNNQQILAFDFDPGDELFYLDTSPGNTAAIVDHSGVWSWNNNPIGNEGAGVPSDGLNSGDEQIVNFVLADTTCQEWISGQNPNDDGNIVLNNIKQHNCKVVAKQKVLVTDLP